MVRSTFAVAVVLAPSLVLACELDTTSTIVGFIKSEVAIVRVEMVAGEFTSIELRELELASGKFVATVEILANPESALPNAAKLRGQRWAAAEKALKARGAQFSASPKAPALPRGFVLATRKVVVTQQPKNERGKPELDEHTVPSSSSSVVLLSPSGSHQVLATLTSTDMGGAPTSSESMTDARVTPDGKKLIVVTGGWCTESVSASVASLEAR